MGGVGGGYGTWDREHIHIYSIYIYIIFFFIMRFCNASAVSLDVTCAALRLEQFASASLPAKLAIQDIMSPWAMSNARLLRHSIPSLRYRSVQSVFDP